MINISNCTSKDNPEWSADEAKWIREDRQPPRGRGAGGVPGPGEGPGHGRSSGKRGNHRGFPPIGGTLLSWVAYALRRWGDRSFANNDDEAYWRGWQITRTHAGLGRRYRDHRFGALAACVRCAGTGALADLPCGPCRGTGRITLGEVG